VSEKQSSRDQAAVSPGRDPWAEGYNPAGRDADGGGYGQQARRHLEADGLVRGGERPDPIAQTASGGAGEEFWGRSNHCAG